MLDAQGRPLPGREEVLVSVYKITSYWWWDAASDSQARYAKNALNTCYKTLQTTLTDGAGQVAMRWSAGDYGYYMIRVTGSGHEHAATQVVCVSSSDWRGDVSSVTDAATRLAVTKDKEKYAPGDKAKITIPSSPEARALVSVESGSVVRESFWIDCADKQTAFEIPIKAGMAPNVYASVTLVQPHNHTHNDAPIRLFGVVRLDVEDAATKLDPVIDMPETVRPGVGDHDKGPGKGRQEDELCAGAGGRGPAGADALQDAEPLPPFQRHGGAGRTDVGHVRPRDRRLRRQDRTVVRHRRRRGAAAEHRRTEGAAVQTRRTVPRSAEARRRQNEHPQNRAAALFRVGARDGRGFERTGFRRRGEGRRSEKTAAGAGHPAARGLHGRRGGAAGDGFRPRKGSRQDRPESLRERTLLGRRPAQQERSPSAKAARRS